MTGTARKIMDDLMAKLSVSRMYVVSLPLPDNFRFNGMIPFDMEIADGTATIKIPAYSMEEAEIIGKKFLGIGE